MVVEAVSHSEVVALVAVVVVASEGRVGLVERLHADAAKQLPRHHLQGCRSVPAVKHVRRDHHGDADVGAELIAQGGVVAADGVSVAGSHSHVLRLSIELRVVRWAGRHPKVLFEVLLQESLPAIPSHCFAFELHSLVRVGTGLVQLSEPLECRVEHPNDLNVSAVSWRGRHALVPGGGRAPHLVHPRSAVVLVSTMNKSRGGVREHVNLESTIHHVLVQRLPSVPLTEVDALSVALHDCLDRLCDCPHLRPRLDIVGVRDEDRHSNLENVEAVGSLAAVVLEGLEEKPDSVASVVARRARVHEVGNQPTAGDRSKRKQVLHGIVPALCEQEEATEADKDIAPPTTHKTRGKVGQASCNARLGHTKSEALGTGWGSPRNLGVDEGSSPPNHLHRAHAKARVEEVAGFGGPGPHQVQGVLLRQCVRRGNDSVKVEGGEERRHLLHQRHQCIQSTRDRLQRRTLDQCQTVDNVVNGPVPVTQSREEAVAGVANHILSDVVQFADKSLETTIVEGGSVDGVGALTGDGLLLVAAAVEEKVEISQVAGGDGGTQNFKACGVVLRQPLLQLRGRRLGLGPEAGLDHHHRARGKGRQLQKSAALVWEVLHCASPIWECRSVSKLEGGTESVDRLLVLLETVGALDFAERGDHGDPLEAAWNAKLVLRGRVVGVAKGSACQHDVPLVRGRVVSCHRDHAVALFAVHLGVALSHLRVQAAQHSPGRGHPSRQFL
mmetsp:Transcript_2713/g.6533  ORF Transcript_2713/g.6533 Transcript_2713/m.6533 type:complete len:726 (-) Transcript_2713:2046-4223(-)